MSSFTQKLGILSLAMTSLMLTLPGQAFAQQRFLQDDLQTWQIFATRGHITKRLLYYFDSQNNVVNLTDKMGNSAKRTDNNKHTHEGQLLLRPALGFEVNKTLSIWQGFGWTPSFQPQFRNEFQLWEQAIVQHNFKYFTISSRSRLEIRRIANAGSTAYRFRNQFRLQVPLDKKHNWAFTLFDEPFWNLNTVTRGPQQGFNQNWLFAGITRKIAPDLSLDVGYLNNYVKNQAPAKSRMNHVIMFSLNYTPKFPGYDLRNLRADKGKAADAETATPFMASLGHALTSENLSGEKVAEDLQSKTGLTPSLEISPIISGKTGKTDEEKEQATEINDAGVAVQAVPAGELTPIAPEKTEVEQPASSIKKNATTHQWNRGDCLSTETSFIQLHKNNLSG